MATVRAIILPQIPELALLVDELGTAQAERSDVPN
jgi:hypothetical protein